MLVIQLVLLNEKANINMIVIMKIVKIIILMFINLLEITEAGIIGQ
jgi:hypothetical protein